MTGLTDLFEPGLRMVVCGTAAGSESFIRGEYYVHPTNVFWKTLHSIGLTSRQLEPSEAGELLKYGIGLSDLVKEFGGSDKSIPNEAWDTGSFLDKIHRLEPQIVAFNGKKAAAKVFGVRSKDLSYGRQDVPLAGATVFVLPSTSGQARARWNEDFWHQLADFAGRFSDAEPLLSVWVPGRPATFATSGERPWKAKLSDVVPTPEGQAE